MPEVCSKTNILLIKYHFIQDKLRSLESRLLVEMKAVHFIEKVSPKLYACRWVTINFCSSLRFTTFRRICYRWRNTRQRLFQTKHWKWKRIRINITKTNDEKLHIIPDTYGVILR